MVYHYTTIETLYNMLATYKSSEDKDYLVFWASNALNQNDSEELSIRKDDIISVIQEIEENDKDQSMTSLRKLSTVEEQDYIPLLNGCKIDIDFDDYTTNLNHTPYTISFSKQRDKLLMWAMYANNGNGICLAFDESKLSCQQNSLLALQGDVVYNNSKDSYKEVVQKLYDMYKKEIKNEYIINKVYATKRLYLTAMIWGISPFIKNKAFEGEAEYRIAFYKKDSEKISVYSRMTSRLNIINYVKANIPITALNHIVIGPCADYSHTKKLLADNLKSCGIVWDFENFIQASIVPFRNY